MTYLGTGNGSELPPVCSGTLSTYLEASSGSNMKKGKETMQEEIQSCVDNQTGELVDLPPTGTVVEYKWVYKVNAVKIILRLLELG